MAAFSTPRGILPMLFALLVFLQAAIALGHGHKAHHALKYQLDEIKSELEARQVNLGWTTGRYLAISGVNPASPAERKEIRDLARNADEWNLYLLGMERFKAKRRDDKVSYYQIAGVHGRPFISWNNFPTPLVNRNGFCPHGQSLFGSWHRPYLAVFEQALHLSIQEVINEFPANQRDRLRNVARNIRIPYWDWAKDPGAGRPAVPTLIRDQTVTVTKPQGPVTIPNPLYSYTFGNTLPAEMGGGPQGNHPTTLRRPVPNPTRSNNNEMNARFGTLRLSLRDRIWDLFFARPVPSWGFVSTSQPVPNSRKVDSFEGIHDAVHVTVGGESGGHMYFLDYSSFDPLFWLHHTNVDRLLAMYQITTPSTYVATARITHPMAQWNIGEEKNAFSPLKPFTKNSNGDYFTSVDVRNTRTLGYFYAETRNNDANGIWNVVNALYGRPGRNRKRSTTYGGYEEPDEYETPAEGEETGDENQYQGRPFKHGEENYVLSIIANKFAMVGSYSLHCFIGSPNNATNVTAPYPQGNTTTPAPYPTEATPYPTSTGSPYNPAEDFTQSPDYVGNLAVLGGSHADLENPLYIEGSLPLTTALQGKEAAGELKSLKRKDVIKYLQTHLYYRVIGPNGEVPADSVPGLHISVKACPVTLDENPYGLPALGEYEKLPECTKDKPAGQPYEHEFTPLEIVKPAPGESYYEGGPTENPSPTGVSPNYPTGTLVFPYPTNPEYENGYCVSKQTVKYVDTDGNFLYQETS